MSNRTVRAAIAGVAGSTVSVAAIAVATPAHAAIAPVNAAATATDESAGSLPICDSWSDTLVLLNNNTQFGTMHIPTAGNFTGNLNCMLNQDPNNVYAGVAKLQTALNKCYGAGLDVDGRYGQLTANAVRKVQAANSGKVAQTGVFERNTSAVMQWPAFSTADNHFIGCALRPSRI